MKNSFSQFISKAALCAAVFSSSAVVASEHCECGPFDQNSNKWNRGNNCGPHLQDAQTVYNKDCHWFANLEYLHWTTKEVDNDFGHTESKKQYMEYDWSSGTRLAVGYRSPSDGWKFSFKYTHFENEGSGSSSDTTYLYGLNYDDLYNTFEDVKAGAALTYDTYDILVSRPTFYSSTLMLEPFFGLRFLNLTTDKEVRGVAVISGSDTNRAYFDGSYRGFGIHMGCEAEVSLGCGFAMAGRFAGSALAGRNSQLHRMTSDIFGSPSTDWEVCSHEYQVLPEFDMNLGLQYEHLMENGVSVTLGALYEYMVWFNTPGMDRVNISRTRYQKMSTTMAFHGFVFRMNLGY